MNTKIQRSSIKAALIAALLLVAGAFSGPANAQVRLAKFTLPFEVHWGQAVLPPGDYLARFSTETPGNMVIFNATNRREVAIEGTDDRDDSAGRRSALLIGTKGREHIVYSLTIAELGETFVYHRLPNSEVKEARQMQTVPVLEAEK